MATYDYLTLKLARGRSAWRRFADGIVGARTQLRDSGGELIGVFSPQLGFASNEAVALVRWPGTPGAVDPIGGSGEVIEHRLEALAASVRPSDDRPLKTGGIYVHRWFTIDEESVDAFVDISAQAWVGFEAAYEVEIFGLFTAARDEEDRAAGQARLLLLTWYAGHGVWETSREQTVDPDGLFTKRHEMTRSTVGRSSLLVSAGV